MRILLIASRFPLPSWRGNQVRTIEWLEALDGHERLLLCPRPAPTACGDLPCEAQFFGGSNIARGWGLLRALTDGRPLQEGVYDTRAARRAVAETAARWKPDVAVIQMVRCAWAVETLYESVPSLRVVFDAIDAMGLHFERAAQAAAPPWRLLLRAEAARCRRSEARLVGAAHLTTAVARRDLEALGVSPEKGCVVPVAGREVPRPAKPTEEVVVLLSGNLGYRPTVRGALWFAREVWPELRRRVPASRWVLAGARPALSLRRLASRPGVEVYADVLDLDPFLAAATVAVAPMHTGSGVPMKVLEAMAAGLPVVADPWAAAGLEEPGAVVSAREGREWVEMLERICTDEPAARALARKGHDLWRRVYHPNKVAERVREAVEAAADSTS
jgi:glycosyltransferase involved in cell wall biosynthesis